MRLLQVNYDLMQPGQDYPLLRQRLAVFGGFSPLQSVWLLPRHAPADAICNDLRGYIDRTDKLIVTEVDAAAWIGLEPWMDARIHAWFAAIAA
jgi:hypothetical protein